jgi:hypothetical protein
MNVAVVGSRKFKDENFLRGKLNELYRLIGKFTVVTGGAEGADSMAIRWANSHQAGMPVPEVFPAEWDDLSHPDALIKMNRSGREYDARAGFRRNQYIVDAADLVVAFINKDDLTPGTADTVKRAEDANKSVLVLWSER